MPRKHEEWCDTPTATDDGYCGSEYVHFGPTESMWEGQEPEPVGGMFAIQRDGGGAEVAIDYRYNDGSMSFSALRIVREAVAESPAEFLAGLDALISLLGDSVPASKA